jgi:transposase-like protein
MHPAVGPYQRPESVGLGDRARAASFPAGCIRIPRKVIAVAVRWFAVHLSDCDVEELVAERGVTIDHVLA